MLTADETPNFIDLYPFAWEITECLVLVFLTSLAHVHQELNHGILGSPGHSLVVAQILLPSTKQERIWARFSVESLFAMLWIVPELA